MILNGSEFNEEKALDVLHDVERLVARLERFLRESGFLKEEQG